MRILQTVLFKQAPKAEKNASQTDASISTVCGELWLRNALAFNTGRIVFASTRDGGAEIYLMGADGGNQDRLTNNPTGDSAPDWSPDGTKIAFVSNRNDGFNQIHVMDADGKNQRRLTHHPADDGLP